ncbi:MAG: AAA family ATPase [Coriobacteriia bacterium]|nr:AAA family ATPase [Coriobacteriia bacterium]
MRVTDVVGYAVALSFLAASAALHAFADARPVAARDSVRMALVALGGANAVGAAFFSFRMLAGNVLAGTLAAFVVAVAPLAARLATTAALARESARLRALSEGVADWEPGGGEAGTAGIAMSQARSRGVIRLPGEALVVLVGAAGCGKTSFAARNFRPSATVSSDELRERVSDDPTKASADAFKLMYQIVGMRLKHRRLTVVDATNVTADKRAELLAISRHHRRPAVAIVLDLPEELCLERNEARAGRKVPVAAVRGQLRHLRHSLPGLPEEGFTSVHVLRTPEELAEARVEVVEPEDGQGSGVLPT